MDVLKELTEQAQELINLGNSKEKARGWGMMEVIEKVRNDFTPKSTSISWSVLDFEHQAVNTWELIALSKTDESGLIFIYEGASSWRDVYDESKFQGALEKMISKHDATTGITWDTITFWLEEMCLKKVKNENTKRQTNTN